MLRQNNPGSRKSSLRSIIRPNFSSFPSRIESLNPAQTFESDRKLESSYDLHEKWTQRNLKNAVSVKIWIRERQTAALVLPTRENLSVTKSSLRSPKRHVCSTKEPSLKTSKKPLQRPLFWNLRDKLKLNLQAECKLTTLFPISPQWKSVVTKTWNYLQPPKTTYNHLQPSTTTSENLTTTYNHLKKFNNHLQPPQKHLKQGINVFKNTRRQHVTYLKYENRTKHPPPPKILLSLVPCIINHALN